MDSKPALQWGRNFIVAETTFFEPTALKNGLASMGPQLYRCGNTHRRHHRRNRSRASMGPQLYRCGNSARSAACSSGSACFNGAATLSLRKREPGGSPRVRHPRFNGAATLSLRKPTCLLVGLSCANSFNGAATLSLRKPAAAMRRMPISTPASMGPQLYRCGNLSMLKKGIKVISSLQWGRNFIVAETGDAGTDGGSGTQLQWGRNFIVAETRRFRRGIFRNRSASMGPQLYRCGNRRRGN